jgi:hypothetical protein
MHANAFAVENKQDTPFVGERYSADDWRHAGSFSTSAVNDHAT